LIVSADTSSRDGLAASIGTTLGVLYFLSSRRLADQSTELRVSRLILQSALWGSVDSSRNIGRASLEGGARRSTVFTGYTLYRNSHFIRQARSSVWITVMGLVRSHMNDRVVDVNTLGRSGYKNTGKEHDGYEQKGSFKHGLLIRLCWGYGRKVR
jgi:hypothetical protein